MIVIVHVEYKHGIIDIPHDSKKREYKARSVVETPSEYFLKSPFNTNRILRVSVKRMTIPNYAGDSPIDFEIVSNSTVCHTNQLHTLTLNKRGVLRLKNTVISDLYSVSSVRDIEITVFYGDQGKHVIKNLDRFTLKTKKDKIIIHDYSNTENRTTSTHEGGSKVLVEVT